MNELYILTYKQAGHSWTSRVKVSLSSTTNPSWHSCDQRNVDFSNETAPDSTFTLVCWKLCVGVYLEISCVLLGWSRSFSSELHVQFLSPTIISQQSEKKTFWRTGQAGKCAVRDQRCRVVCGEKRTEKNTLTLKALDYFQDNFTTFTFNLLSR